MTRTGGVSGLRRQWAVEAASDDEAQPWWPLVDACPWGSPTEECDPDAVRDGFVYEVQANDREAMLAEKQVDGPWRDLVDAVVHHED